ncbi:hypothetical protein E6P97_01855 [Patescibacteria group bacterium]|nr:MAG: hypothetical protein E6P97_01855 [Patescibacteria group bacterium]
MENRLEHLSEFQTILEKYRISATARKILDTVQMVLMVGPSSCGRNTIINYLVEQGGYQFLVSDTTRAKRTNNGVMEQDGVEYWFRREADVLADLQAGNFLEAAIIHGQQVSGISIRELERAAQNHLVGITDIEIVGVDTIKAHKPDAHAVFVLPPNFTAWQERLNRRGDMSVPEKRRRMESAVHEFAHALEMNFYQFVINDTIEQAAEQVRRIVAHKVDKASQQRGREICMELLAETQYWLRHS